MMQNYEIPVLSYSDNLTWSNHYNYTITVLIYISNNQSVFSTFLNIAIHSKYPDAIRLYLVIENPQYQIS